MLPLLVATVFYVLLPMVGAWRVRRTWVRFRQAALQALASPELPFSLLQPGTPPPRGTYRMTGTLEAFEGDDRLWIGNSQVSAAVSLRGTVVYFLDTPERPVDADPPRKADALSLGALPEGTQFLVCGSLATDPKGQLHFASGPESGLLILAFEGPPETVLSRAVFSGRPKVDHWNPWTPVSLGIGFLLLLTLAYAELRTGGRWITGLEALALALLPATFFLPPGILFFFGFARAWARGRASRAWADSVRLGLPPGPEPRRSALWSETVAHLLLLGGAAGNLLLLEVVLRLVLPAPGP